MYPFLQGFRQVSVEEIKEAQRRDEIVPNLYCLNDISELTHLLIKGGLDRALLTQLLPIKSLKQLTLQHCQLAEIPEIICQFTQLTLLDLDNNQISQLPEDFFKLKQLEHLSLNKNKISSINNNISYLKKLIRLELNDNKLGKVPEIILQLSQLQTLYLSKNQIKELPEIWAQLSQLQSLDLENNQITELPETFAKLHRLQFLDLSFNQIDKLPESIGHLAKLEYLLLADNKINNLPKSLTNTVALEIFDIEDNPISNNIHDIARSLPPEELIAYLLEIQKEETQTLNESKILVLGDERVGKTSIINRIIGRKMDENEKSTLGIDIQQYPLDNGINVNIWDFAGQEIAHQTHQFFLSSRSLYLYVLDAQKEDNDAGISQWLNTINAIAGDSPIVVVVNKSDLNPSYQFDIHRYQKEFNIVDLLYVSAEENSKIADDILAQISHSIDELRAVIEQQTANIKEAKLPFPASWLAVKSQLEEKQQQDTDFIESSIYEQICESNGLVNESLQDALLSVLNQIGTIVTYRNHQRLNVMQIINPAWVTNGVYKVLRSPFINKSQATLNKQQFKKIFANDKKYEKPRHYTWLIDLLKQFQLAFSIDSHTVLIPSRLESAEPEFELDDYQKGLNFRFKYESILKKSVLSQFIVLMHEYISDEEVKYWQRGVFLQYEKAKAVVISDEEKKTITIAVDQSSRSARELLTIIRHCIRKINGTNLVVDEQVPLLINNELYGFKSYDEILEAEQEDDKTIRAAVTKGEKKSFKFNVSELLDGYRIKDDTLFDYRQFENELFDISCLETENRHAIFNEKEDLTNDRFKTALLNRKYKVADQSRGGESGTALSAGERDLVLRDPHKNHKLSNRITRLGNSWKTQIITASSTLYRSSSITSRPR